MCNVTCNMTHKDMLAGIAGSDEAESIQLYLGFPSIIEAQNAWDVAVENGAKVRMPFMPQKWGRQYGIFIDPFGVAWYAASELFHKQGLLY